MAEPLPVKSLRIHEFIWDKLGQVADEYHLTRAGLFAKWLADDREQRFRELNLQLAQAEQDDDG